MVEEGPEVRSKDSEVKTRGGRGEAKDEVKVKGARDWGQTQGLPRGG